MNKWQESYSEYRKTDQWKEIKRQVKGRDHYCKICYAGSSCCDDHVILDAHHKNYKHLHDELNWLEDLVLLCRECHQEVHRDPELRKSYRY